MRSNFLATASALLVLALLVVLLNLFLSLTAPINTDTHVEKNGKLAVRVATYNLWNYMFHWELRKQHIAKLIRKYDPEIIGFQEVRTRDLNWTSSQLLDLAALLPRYRYKLHAPATTVTGGEGVAEGVGLLCKHRLIDQKIFQFPRNPSDPDRNQRIALWALVDLDDETTPSTDPAQHRLLNVIVTHFSYERSTQCSNFVELVRILLSGPTSLAQAHPFVILGDLNTYNDSKAPLDLLNSAVPLTNSHRCYSALTSAGIRLDQIHHLNLLDVWSETHKGEPESAGYTFSTMPWPGLVARPDHILISNSGLDVRNVIIDNSSKEYKVAFYWKIGLARLRQAGYSSAHLLVVVVCAVSSCALVLISILASRMLNNRRFMLIGSCLVGAVAFALVVWAAAQDMSAVAFHPAGEDYNPSDHLMLVADLEWRAQPI